MICWFFTDCGSLGAPTNGDIVVGLTTYGSSATFSCGPLYQMNGAPVLTCEDGGTWSSPPPVCDDIGKVVKRKGVTWSASPPVCDDIGKAVKVVVHSFHLHLSVMI